MVDFTIETRIRASRKRVFDVFADLSGAVERLSQVTRVDVVTEGPVGEGTRWREWRLVLGNEMSDEMTITRYDPPSSYRAEGASMGTEYAIEFHFESEAESTLVTTRCECRATTLVTSLLMPLAPVIVDRVESQAKTDLDDFRRWLEDEASGATRGDDAGS